ncbi:MAG: DUF4349 domain-containing protein [Chloroflexi bacterium]|nr:DUF4349 domain-containing protein [Chloroflexota bacterium]
MLSVSTRSLIIGGIALLGLAVCGLVSLALLGAGGGGDDARLVALLTQPATRSDAYLMATATMSANLYAAQPTQAAELERSVGSADDGSGGEQDQQQNQDEPQPGERIVIRSARLIITVDDTAARVSELTALAAALDGWVVSSNTRTSTDNFGREVVYGDVSLRIPAQHLDEALNRIRALALQVNSENISGQDVTQDYVDTSSRLRNLEAAEAQLQTIMDAAQTVEEVMIVYNQLVQVRSDIEVARGRLQYFQQSAAFSAVTITIYPEIAPYSAPTPTPPPGWTPMVAVANAFGTLVRLTQGAVDALLTVLVCGVPLLLIAAPVFVLWRRRR